MELAENLALDHDYDKELGKRLKDPPQSGGYHYVNAKKLNLKDPEEEEDGTPDIEKYYSVDRSVDDPKFMVGYSRLNLEANKYFSGKLKCKLKHAVWIYRESAVVFRFLSFP